MKRCLYILLLLFGVNCFAMSRLRRLARNRRKYISKRVTKNIALDSEEEELTYFDELGLIVSKAKKTGTTAILKSHLYNLEREHKLQEAQVFYYVHDVEEEIMLCKESGESDIPSELIAVQQILKAFDVPEVSGADESSLGT